MDNHDLLKSWLDSGKKLDREFRNRFNKYVDGLESNISGVESFIQGFIDNMKNDVVNVQEKIKKLKKEKGDKNDIKKLNRQVSSIYDSIKMMKDIKSELEYLSEYARKTLDSDSLNNRKSYIDTVKNKNSVLKSFKSDDLSGKTCYITTPIYYPSGRLHIGNSYTTILCDAIARFKRMLGYDVHFITGMDEHGQKIQDRAEGVGVRPKALVDDIADQTKELWSMLNIEYDDFIRTTEERHKNVVKSVFRILEAEGKIYKDEYEGYYCPREESYYTETQLNEGCCPDCGDKLEKVKEDTRKLKISDYKEWLRKSIKSGMFDIENKDEVLNMIDELEDLSITRSNIDWGIRNDHGETIYVWFDALLNYLSSLGYLDNYNHEYINYWASGNEIIQVVGKDIVKFHAIYWPIVLKMLGIPTHKTEVTNTETFEEVVFNDIKLHVHGWYTMDDEKMSKSKGNVITPEPLVKRYGADPLRYFLLKELRKNSDGKFTAKSFIDKINIDLVNNIGNLLHRTISMINKYGLNPITISDYDMEYENDVNLKGSLYDHISKYETYMTNIDVPKAINEILVLTSETNKFIDLTKPWILGKELKEKNRLLETGEFMSEFEVDKSDPEYDKKLAKYTEEYVELEEVVTNERDKYKEDLIRVLSNLSKSLYVISYMLYPIMPNTAKTMLGQLNIDIFENGNWDDIKKGLHGTIKVVLWPKHIYSRLNLDEEIEYIQSLLD